MLSSETLAAFIGSSFRSVWALELLLLLRHQARACTTEEMVSLLRASPSIVDKALRELEAAGLASTDEGGALYMPVSGEVAAMMDQTEQLYRSHPNRVRRLIVASSNKALTSFSDAFRLKD